MLSRPEALADVLDQAWGRLEEGATQRKSPFHQGVLASVSGDGAEARYVVVRGVERARSRLRFHSDRRSPKLVQLQHDPRAAWCFFGEGVQLRLSGACSVLVEGEDVEQAWTETTDFGRRCYRARQAPGATQGHPGPGLPDSALSAPPDPADVALGRANFAIVQFQVESIDWLHLGHEGHRRALFEAADGWQGHWIQP
jgi:pyridoxamine 5'-phosphate oxidase